MSLAGACQLSQQHEENKGDMNSCRNSFTDYSHDDDDGDDEGRTELKGDLGLIIWASLVDPPSSSPLPWYVATREQNVPAPEWEEPISGRVIYTARRGGSCLPSNTWKLEREGAYVDVFGGEGVGAACESLARLKLSYQRARGSSGQIATEQKASPQTRRCPSAQKTKQKKPPFRRICILISRKLFPVSSALCSLHCMQCKKTRK